MRFASMMMNHSSNGDTSDYYLNGNGITTTIRSSSSSSPSKSKYPISSPPSIINSDSPNYIIHTISKFDTLAGVAIKYGVEVADIKKLNGLVSDVQMFALNTLLIPLPGRHPPSPVLSIGDESQSPKSPEQNISLRRNSDIFDSFQSLKLKSSSERKVCPATSSFLNHYGLNPSDENSASEGFEMGVYRDGGSRRLQNGLSSPLYNQPLSLHRKSKSAANGLGSASANNLMDPYLSHESETSKSDKWIMTVMQRCQNSETDFSARTPEKLLKEENTASSIISPLTGKGLALRPKSVSRTASGVDVDPVSPTTVSVASKDNVSTECSNGVRKCLSTPSLQGTDNSSLSSIWLTSKWSLKPDFQALSNAALPIFDGLPKHIGKRNKAALD